MIGYACVGTNDWQRALAFYDALLAELGAKRVMMTHMNPTMLARTDEAKAAGVLIAADGLGLEF